MRTGFARLNDREMLQKYGDKKGHFRLHYVTQTKIAHPYLLESFNGAYLFITEETKKKISKANKGNKYGKKKVICLELKRIFNSAKEASEFLDYSRGSLSTAIKKGHKCRGLTFKYITIIEL